LFILDPGHGPNTVGKQSPPTPEGEVFYEYEGNRKILGYLAEELRSRGIEFRVTNEPELPSNSLKLRVDRANAFESYLPKVFISIHCNAADPDLPRGWTTANGVEVFHYPGNLQGRYAATVLQKHLLAATGRRDRGVKERKYYVLQKTTCLALLGETLFMNNREELDLLLQDEYIRTIATQGYLPAILELEREGIPGYEKLPTHE